MASFFSAMVIVEVCKNAYEWVLRGLQKCPGRFQTRLWRVRASSCAAILARPPCQRTRASARVPAHETSIHAHEPPRVHS